MYKFFCFFVLLFSIKPCLGQEDFSLAPQTRPNDALVHKIEKNIIPIMTCDDSNLIKETKEFVKNFYEKNIPYSVKDKRKKHFVMNSLDLFEQENIANYKSSKMRPVSDLIANLLINEAVLEENMRLCKNQSKNKEASEVYLLIHADENMNQKVYVLNLQSGAQKFDNNFFVVETK